MISTFRRFNGTAACGMASRAVVVALTLSLGACAQMGDMGLGFGKEPAPAETAVNDGKNDGKPEGPASELQKATTYWGKEVAKNPKDGTAALNYARNLKAMGRKQDALGVLQAGYLYNADKTDYLSEYGRLSLDLGQISTAAQLLERADDPTKPDWRVASARGTVLAKQGHYKESIPFFERAREMAPSQSTVLNNLAMAYAMDGQADKAEELLRQAQQAGAADPRVKQNLALVLGLQGKKAEAQQIAGGDGEASAATPVAAAASGAASTANAGKISASEPMTAAVAQVAATSLDPDELIRLAKQAEEDKKKPAKTASSKTAKKKTQVASGDSAPMLKASAD